MTARRLLAIAVLLTTINAGWMPARAAGQDDAGLGRDAPDRWQDAAPLALGSYVGRVGPWEYGNFVEQADWFVVDVPAGSWFHAEVQRLGGAMVDWTNIEILDATGVRLAFLSFPYGDAFSRDVRAPGGPLHVGVWTYGGNGITDYALRLSILPEDDGGTGEDAPDDQASAWPWALGMSEGLLDPRAGDSADWYLVTLPPGRGLLVFVEAWNGNARVDAIATSGGYRQTRMNGWVWPLDLYLPRYADAYWIGIQSTDGIGGGYRLRLEALPLPDLRIVEVRVGEDTLRANVDDPALSHPAREVEVDLVNVGEGATSYETIWGPWPEGGELSLWTHGLDSGRFLGRYRFSLDPGESTTVRAVWDTTGQVGEQDLVVHAWTRFEKDPTDNSVETRASVLAPVPGVDATNRFFAVSPSSASMHEGALPTERGLTWLWMRHGSCDRGGRDSYRLDVHAQLPDLHVRLTGERTTLMEASSHELHPKNCDGWDRPEPPVQPLALPSARARMASVSYGPATLLLGGEGSEGLLDDGLAFLAPAEVSAPLAFRLPSPRAAMAAATDGTFVHLFGGEGEDGPIDEILRYHPPTGLVETLDLRLPSPRAGAVAVFDARTSEACPSGCYYVFGGLAPRDEYTFGFHALDEVLRFDPASGALVLLETRMPKPHIVGPWTWDGERISFFGLLENNGIHSPYGDAWFYDPSADEGTQHDQRFLRRDGAVAFAVEDVTYLMGGGVDEVYEDERTGYALDPSSAYQVELRDAIRVPFRDGVAVPFDGGAYLIGGRDPTTGGLSANVERWVEPEKWWRDW